MAAVAARYYIWFSASRDRRGDVRPQYAVLTIPSPKDRVTEHQYYSMKAKSKDCTTKFTSFAAYKLFPDWKHLANLHIGRSRILSVALIPA